MFHVPQENIWRIKRQKEMQENYAIDSSDCTKEERKMQTATN